MRKFSFRLQKVLDYNRTLEENAKQAYLDAQRRTREVDLEIERLQLQQSELLTRPIVTIGDRLALDAWLNRCDDGFHIFARRGKSWSKKRSKPERLGSRLGEKPRHSKS